MVRQYKHGLGKVLTEFPSGYMDGDESPLDCARRELLEETGYAAGKWTKLGTLAREPHYSETVIHIWKAEELKLMGAPKPDDTEDLSLVFKTGDEIKRMLAEGEMMTSFCAAAWGLLCASS